MAFNFVMRPMLSYFFMNALLAGDHRVLHGGAAPAIGTVIAGFHRERAPIASWTPAMARRRPGAQLRHVALVVRGGGRRGREHGVDPPSGGGRSGVQETSIPSCGAREHGPIFAACARFASREAATFALFGMVPLSQMSLPLCWECSHNLT